MKTRYIAAAMALVMLFVTMGCSRREERPDESMRPSESPLVDDFGTGTDRNDAFEGGGAGGTEGNGNEQGQNRIPDTSPAVSGDGMLDDIENGVGDMIDGVGDAARDAGNAIGDAAKRAGDAMK